jgi:hypothetical protein
VRFRPTSDSHFRISWARSREPSVDVEGPNYLIINAVEQPSKHFTAVHLVNYNFHEA